MSENKYRNRLYLLRKTHRMSQKIVCEKIGIATKTLYNLERGLRPIPSDKLIEFAKLYKCSCDYILCFDSGNSEKTE